MPILSYSIGAVWTIPRQAGTARTRSANCSTPWHGWRTAERGLACRSRRWGAPSSGDPETGIADGSKSPVRMGASSRYSNHRCCDYKKRQSRREERSLVNPNERRATQSGTFLATTRRAGAIFPPSCVVTRSSSGTTPRSFRLASQKSGLRQFDSSSLKRPLT
jgi:hypothetical protein